jgi:organic radical activating enzyme
LGKLFIEKIEFDVVEHCNLRCYGCSHVSPYFNKSFASFESFKRDVDILKDYIHLERLKLLGGEPLLHPDLNLFMLYAKDSGLADKICIATNGVLLGKQTEEFWNIVDWVDISLYSNLIDTFDDDLYVQLAEKHNVKLRIRRKSLFRDTIMDYPTKDERLTNKIYKTCTIRFFCNTFRNGYYYPCSVAAFIDSYLERLGYKTNFALKDGLKLERKIDLSDSIYNHIHNKQPLNACSFCLGNVGKVIEQRQLTSAEMNNLIKVKRGEECVDKKQLSKSLVIIYLREILHRMPTPIRNVLAGKVGRSIKEKYYKSR